MSRKKKSCFEKLIQLYLISALAWMSSVRRSESECQFKPVCAVANIANSGVDTRDSGKREGERETFNLKKTKPIHIRVDAREMPEKERVNTRIRRKPEK